MKCPACGFQSTPLYKCKFCGDVRCGSTTGSGDKGACGNSKSPFGRPQAAAENRQCRVCAKPSAYQKI